MSWADQDPRGAATDSGIDLLFIHHSCGGTLLADPGVQEGGKKGSGRRCIYGAHPNGGGLRSMLREQGYLVHELSYESALGEDTDIQHWRRKFADHLPELLRSADQGEPLAPGRSNEIIIFKSCYPNNDYVGLGQEPGDPDSPERTVANSKAAYESLLPLFQQHPEVLFVAFTPPPRAKPQPQGVWGRVKSWFGSEPETARWARVFNGWLADPRQGWLADYPLKNVVVFDYYDILTQGGQSDWSRFATRGGTDSHPSREGNALAADLFIPFLADSVERWQGTRK